jgi:predicted DNA-binding transcriptional regulator AlpA
VPGAYFPRAMINEPADRERLRAFFNVKPRGLPGVLRDLKIRPIGGRVRWPVVWAALGLAAEQDPNCWKDLLAQLMTAEKVADYCGVDARTIYRWRHGQGLPSGLPPMPAPIDLSGGRENARKLRWRRAEIVAWQNRKEPPVYARAAPVLGTLKPTR